jgi:antitoxin ParD1/3/4
MPKIDKDCYSSQHLVQGVILMNVSLTPELEEFIVTKVGSGRYNSASEVVREALRLLEEHDQARSAQIAAFNKELGHRLASLDCGEKVDPAAVRARIDSRSRARRMIRA